MPRNDKLYEESRIIRKAVQEGKTTSEIMQMLSLTSAQIKYRIETRYTDKIASGIIKALEQNDKGIHIKEEIQKTEFPQHTESVRRTDTDVINTIVVDTCSLKCNGSFEFVMSYETVILLVDIVKQMNNHKADDGIFGRNIRALLRESAEDQAESKIKIRTAGEETDSTDSKLLSFCKEKDVVLYTADNALATIARYFDIKYILAKDFDKNESENTTKQPGKATTVKDKEEKSNDENSSSNSVKEEKCEAILPIFKQKDVEELKKQMQENSITKGKTEISRNTINNVSMLGKFLTLIVPETHRINYQVISGNELKHPVSSNMVNLKIGDVIVVSTYKRNEKFLSINRYEIIDIADKDHARYLGTDRVKEDNQIEKLDLPYEAKRELKRYFSLAKNN